MEILLEKFNHNGISYYRDKNGTIIDTNCKVVGAYSFDGNEYKYYFKYKVKIIKFSYPYV